MDGIPTARVPIVKIVHAKTGIQCDIGINTTLGLHNTRLMRLYAQLDPRVRPVCRGVGSGGTHSSTYVRRFWGVGGEGRIVEVYTAICSGVGVG